MIPDAMGAVVVVMDVVAVVPDAMDAVAVVMGAVAVVTGAMGAMAERPVLVAPVSVMLVARQPAAVAMTMAVVVLLEAVDVTKVDDIVAIVVVVDDDVVVVVTAVSSDCEGVCVPGPPWAGQGAGTGGLGFFAPLLPGSAGSCASVLTLQGSV